MAINKFARSVSDFGSFDALVAAFAPARRPPTGARTLANAFSTDLTGLWYNPQESGWGVNIIQQAEVLFVTMFVYDSSNKPIWFSGSDVSFASVDAQGGFTFTGALYQTTGSYYGANYNPVQSSVTQVGTVSLRFASYTTGTMTYTVNGVTVVKNIIPQTWRANDMTGNYVGTMVGATACTLPLPQPTGLLNVHITQSGLNANLQITDATGAQCTLTGTVSPFGKLADVDGATAARAAKRARSCCGKWRSGSTASRGSSGRSPRAAARRGRHSRGLGRPRGLAERAFNTESIW